MQRWSKWWRSYPRLLAALLPVLAACQQQQPLATPAAAAQTTGGKEGSKRLIEIVRSTGQRNPPAVPYSPQPLRDGPGGAGERPQSAVTSPHYTRALGSSSQNSRTPGSLSGGGPYRVRWQAAVPTAPSVVLVAGERVVAQRASGWTLFDTAGKELASGASGRSVMSLDPSVNMFYAMGNGNTLQALALDSGELRFGIPLGYNETFIWPLVHRSGKNIAIAGIELPTLSPANRPPQRSLFQVVRVGSPVKLSPYKLLLSLEIQQDLIFQESAMVPTAAGDLLWAVMPNLIVRTSTAQAVDGAWSDAFEPVAASADEAGWLYALVSTRDGRQIWTVTPEGIRTARIAVPAAYAETKIPPAVGYDHRVYLRTSQDIVAFSPSGEKLWEVQVATGAIAGMSVTPDGQVVVAAGPAILLVDAGGRVTSLATLPGSATTAPVVSAGGEILVGTEGGVLCLSAR